jgi:hypothetical protein
MRWGFLRNVVLFLLCRIDGKHCEQVEEGIGNSQVEDITAILDMPSGTHWWRAITCCHNISACVYIAYIHRTKV